MVKAKDLLPGGMKMVKRNKGVLLRMVKKKGFGHSGMTMGER